MNEDDRRMLLGLCLSMHTPLILWFLLLPCIAAWRLHPPDKTLVLPCPVALEKTTGSVSWFRDGQRSLFNTSESSSLVIKDPWYTESGNYTCCYAFSNWTGNADCFSSYIVFADKTELPPNLLRDTLPQPGETPIFKGITYWQPALLLSFRPANFFKRTNFSCLYFIPTTTRIPKIEWFFLHSNSELSHNISTEELPCPSELLDGLHGIYEEDDFYGIRNRCFRSVLTLNYRALGQDGEYVCQVTAQEGVDVEMPIRFHFPLGYPLERLVHPRLASLSPAGLSGPIAAAHRVTADIFVRRAAEGPQSLGESMDSGGNWSSGVLLFLHAKRWQWFECFYGNSTISFNDNANKVVDLPNGTRTGGSDQNGQENRGSSNFYTF
ncbi:hypothetical protein SprV_0200542700 [Sparganum proliferum]